jgi:GTP-binding protein EngB required for normal cell division
MTSRNIPTGIGKDGSAMQLRVAYETLERICGSFRIDFLRPRLAAIAEGLSGEGVVDVAVLGQFKAGKSSFLNSLFGKEVVPVHVLPATSVVTRIGYGQKERVVVRRLFGDSEEITMARLPEFVTERGNPENRKQVSIVDVELPGLESYRGIRFVDTPGLGSIFSHNTQVSMDWLPRVGGALVAVSVNHPLSREDLALLSEVFLHTPEVAILLTKADLVTESELDAVSEFTCQQVAHHTSRELPILPFSVLPRFDAFREEVREYLRRRIVAGREERFLGIMSHKLRTLAAECRSYLLLAKAASEAAENAREDLKRILTREREDLKSIRGEVDIHLRNLKAQVRTTAGERYHAHRGEVAGRLQRALDTESPAWRGNLGKTARRFQEWLRETLEKDLSDLSGRGEEYLSGYLLNAQTSLHRTVRAFQDRIAKKIEQALGITFEGASFHAAIAEPTRPNIRVGKIFAISIDLLWFLIPMGLVRSLVFRHFRERIAWESEKNLSRLASQWADAVNASIDDLARQAMAFVSEELVTIQRLVAGAEDRSSDIRDALEELRFTKRSDLPADHI